MYNINGADDYRLGLSGQTATLPKPDPKRCLWAEEKYCSISREMELFCHFPSRYGVFYHGICGDYLEKREGES